MFDSYLQNDLRYLAGLRTTFVDKTTTVAEWIGDGGEHEDDDTRYYRHFHDPLRPWDSAGLQLAPLTPRFDSSIVWMQQPQGWSWQEARGFYYAALTAGDPQQRGQKWADALQAVGQIMHLIEDAAQPAHVRNDPHPVDYICRTYFGVSCGGNFEYWVSGNLGAYSYSGAPSFQPLILDQATNHSEAPVPVANLIDNDIYLGFDANVTVGTLVDGQEVTTAPVGIAEFTNANFFSEDNVGLYAHPDVNALVESSEAAPTAGALRRYLRKGDGDGLPLNPALVESVFGAALRSVASLSGTYEATLAGQDENVWQAEAKVLIPKATRYAQGALDYFFRGQLDFVPAQDGPNGFLIKNLGADDLNGTFELYYDDPNGNRQPVPGSNGWQLSILGAQHCPNGAACNQAAVQAFDRPFDAPPSGTYTLVFHGTMGSEVPGNGSLGAVAAKVVQSSSFLLLTAQSAYRSAVLDHGWQRVGSGLPVPVDYDGSSRICTNGCQGIAINASTIVFNRHGDASSCTESPYYWDGINTVLLSTDGGRTFSDQSPTIYSTYSVRPANMIHLGGGKLLASYYSQTCWSDWIECPWSGYPNVSACVSCTPLDPALRYGEQCRADYNGPWGTIYSDDLGATWQLRPGVGSSGYYIGDHTVIVGGALSVDDGLTWAPVDFVVDDQPAPELYIFGLAWNRKVGDNRVLLALAWPDPSGSTIALLKSNDGIHWRLLKSFAQLLEPPRVEQPESLAIGPDGSGLMTVYVYEYTAGAPCRGCGHYVVYASRDGGETWDPATLPAGGSSLPTAAYSMGVVYVGSDAPAP